MRASILIAAHNEGDRLLKTVESILETIGKLDAEVVVGDDGSTDGSIEELRKHFPRVVVVSQRKRVGVAAARGLAVSRARGNVLVFLDGHTKPEPGALERLVTGVRRTGGDAIITPQVIGLNEKNWQSQPQQTGNGYAFDLETFDTWWVPLKKMKEVKEGKRSFFESPALIGCALAVSRKLYDRLWGFDPLMRQYGVEDLDFALKAWTMGARVLHDPEATVAHRFQRHFGDYQVGAEHPLANRIRAARKHFTQSVWEDWLLQTQEQQRKRLKNHPEGLWARAWQIYQRNHQSAEHERVYLLSRRTMDEFGYAKRFGRPWPTVGATLALPAGRTPSKKDIYAVALASPPPDPPTDPAYVKWVSDIVNEAATVSYCAGYGGGCTSTSPNQCTGWHRSVNMQIYTSTDDIWTLPAGGATISESFTLSGSNGLGIPAPTPMGGSIEEDSLYADDFHCCSTSCPGNTGQTKYLQGHQITVNSTGQVYTLANIEIVYKCGSITIGGL